MLVRLLVPRRKAHVSDPGTQNFAVTVGSNKHCWKNQAMVREER